VRFEWDEEKNVANRKKHGIGFDTAIRVFADAECILLEDRIDEHGEMRWHAIGLVDATLLVAVHVYRSTSDEEIIRIISARKASQRESRRYFQ
jgi:uncharacterized DUF497 family protein